MLNFQHITLLVMNLIEGKPEQYYYSEQFKLIKPQIKMRYRKVKRIISYYEPNKDLYRKETCASFASFALHFQR